MVDGNASAISSIVFGKWNATRGETDGTMQVLLNRKKYNVGKSLLQLIKHEHRSRSPPV